MRYTSQMTIAIALLLTCVAYSVVASLASSEMPALHARQVFQYAMGLWLISGLIGIVLGAFHQFKSSKFHLIYLGWAVSIPFVEVLLAFRIYSEHWLLPLPPDTVVQNQP